MNRASHSRDNPTKKALPWRDLHWRERQREKGQTRGDLPPARVSVGRARSSSSGGLV